MKKALIRNNAGKKTDKFNDDSNDNASMDELIASLGKGAGDDESNRFKNQAAFTQEQADHGKGVGEHAKLNILATTASGSMSNFIFMISKKKCNEYKWNL